MPRIRTLWRCQQCGASAPRWIGRCPECGEYGSYVEEAEAATPAGSKSPATQPVRLADVEDAETERRPTGVAELDRVLGGGLVAGSLVLLGGEPGIGKSTLLLQAAASIAACGEDVLYVCGEESPGQVGMRARRIGAEAPGLRLLPEVDIRAAEEHAVRERPALLVIDSIQTAFDPDLAGAPGSVGQVRACTARLLRVSKDHGVTTVIVGHVTKEGAIAGPRVLEHMVDTVLYFEGDRDHAFRIVRAVKNRFGSASEIGVFSMGERGLEGVAHPSAVLLADRAEGAPGSVVMPLVEGARPLLVEMQALVTPTFLPQPRRLANGLDMGRLLQVLAVLERRAGIAFGSHDVYASVAGGVRVTEPAADLPLALALVSSLKDRPVPRGLVAFGELGLTGEVRPVSHAEARLKEAARMGFDRCACGAPSSTEPPEGISLEHQASIAEALELLA